MTAALLYRPTRSWQIWAAFAGAVLLHVAALAMAQNRYREFPVATNEDAGVEIQIVPADEAPLQAELTEAPPTPPTEEPMFQTEHSTPPRFRRKTGAQSLSLVRLEIGRSHATAGIGAVRVLALSAPSPEYPFEARRQRTTGSGVAVLIIDQLTGEVTNVSMSRSLGSPVLDHAAINGLRRWRFKPGTVTTVNVPITYSLNGVFY